MEYDVGTKVFGDWEIVRQIGEGSFGKVYEVRKSDFGVETVSALKVIRTPASQAEMRSAIDEGMDEQSVTSYFKGRVDSILHEIAVMSSLKGHPNIVGYEDHQLISYENEIRWDVLIRMELLTPLAAYQRANGFPVSEVIRLGRELCSALAFCERKNITHRDIKPENIFVSETGLFKLGDFGEAKAAAGSRSVAGTLRGTDRYMAPEVYLNKPYGKTVDLYSLGLVLYRLLNNNRLPFLPPAPQPIGYADFDNANIRRMKGEALPPPSQADETLAAIMLKACAFRSKDRWRSAAEMLAALDQYAGITEQTPPPRTAAQPAPGGSDPLDGGPGTVGGGTIGGGTVGGWGTHRSSAQRPQPESAPSPEPEEGGGTVGGWGTHRSAPSGGGTGSHTVDRSGEYSVKFTPGSRTDRVRTSGSGSGRAKSTDTLDDFLKQRVVTPPPRQAGLTLPQLHTLWKQRLPQIATPMARNCYFAPDLPKNLLSWALADQPPELPVEPKSVIGLLTPQKPETKKPSGLKKFLSMGTGSYFNGIMVTRETILLAWVTDAYKIAFRYRDIKDVKVVEDPGFGNHKLKILLRNNQILLFSPGGGTYVDYFNMDCLRDTLLYLGKMYGGVK